MNAVSWLPVLMVMLGLGGTLPLGVPPAEEDPALAAVAPEECVLYVTWSGTVQPDAESENQTEQLLAEPEVQKLLAEVERAINAGLKQSASHAPPDAAPLLKDLSRWWPKLVSKPGAIFVSEIELEGNRPDVRGGLLLYLGDDAEELEKIIAGHLRRLLRGAMEESELDGASGYRIQLGPQMPPIFWGVRDGYLGVAVGEGVPEEMLKRLEGESPEWLTTLREQLPIERRSTLCYLNVDEIKETVLEASRDPKLGEAIEALGLGNVTALASTSGLDGQGFATKTLITIDGEPQGLLGLLPDKPLSADDLAPIPSDAVVAAAARVDAGQVFDTLMGILEKLDPRAHGEAMAAVEQLQREIGVELRDELLESLGDVWRIYLSPSQTGLLPTGALLVVDVDDSDKLKESLQKLRDAFARVSKREESPKIEKLEFAGQEICYLAARRPDFPLAPAWCVTEDQFIVGLFPQSVKAYLSPSEDREPITAVSEVAELVKGEAGPEKLLYIDTPTLFKFVYPWVSMGAQVASSQLRREGIDFSVAAIPSAEAISRHLFPSVVSVRRTEDGIEIASRQPVPGVGLVASSPAVFLTLPAVMSARMAAGRSQSMNNLKQIMLALHNYHDTYKRFPPQYSVDKDGKPLLSWRVLILPFLEQDALYRQFHLDEPWDSEHNKKLAETVVNVYRSPSSKTEPWKTNYLGISGKGAVFNGEKGVGIRDITDGTSNTVAVVEANDDSAVIWTKPDDLVPDPDNPTAGLIGLRPNGFLAAFCDGSVRFLNQTLPKDTFNGLFTIAGAEVFELP